MTDTDEPDRGGRRARTHGLVRPYVLSSGGHAHRRATQRDAGERLTRGDRRAFDWTAGMGSQREREARSESTRRDGRARPGAATAPLPSEEPARIHRAVQRRSLGWLVGVGAGLAAPAVVGGLILFTSRPASKQLADACGAGDCRQGNSRTPGGTKLPAGAPASTHKAIRGTHPTVTDPTAQRSAKPTRSHPVPSPTSPTNSSPAPTATATSPRATPTTTTPSTSPTPSQAPTSTPTSSPTPKSVQVSYAVVDQWKGGFHGQFTIVNKGSTAINGWQLAVVLPADTVQSVWDGQFHTHGRTLYIDPSSSQQTIAPGETLTEDVIANGSKTNPRSCMFNDSAC